MKLHLQQSVSQEMTNSNEFLPKKKTPHIEHI